MKGSTRVLKRGNAQAESSSMSRTLLRKQENEHGSQSFFDLIERSKKLCGNIKNADS